MLQVKSGIVEIKSKDPYMRSFLVPHKVRSCRVHVWMNRRDDLYAVGLYFKHPQKGHLRSFRKNLTAREVLELLRDPKKHTPRK